MKRFELLAGQMMGMSLLAMLLSCSSNPVPNTTHPVARQTAPPPASANAPATVEPGAGADSLPTIAYLERRSQTIAIKAGPNGVVYTVTDKQGNVLHRDLSEQELQAKAPDLYRFLKTAIGQGKGTKANDASLRVSPAR